MHLAHKAVPHVTPCGFLGSSLASWPSPVSGRLWVFIACKRSSDRYVRVSQARALLVPRACRLGTYISVGCRLPCCTGHAAGPGARYRAHEVARRTDRAGASTPGCELRRPRELTMPPDAAGFSIQPISPSHSRALYHVQSAPDRAAASAAAISSWVGGAAPVSTARSLAAS